MIEPQDVADYFGVMRPEPDDLLHQGILVKLPDPIHFDSGTITSVTVEGDGQRYVIRFDGATVEKVLVDTATRSVGYYYGHKYHTVRGMELRSYD